MEIELGFVQVLQKRIDEPQLLIQVVMGPRQVGKTTGIKQLLEKIHGPSVYASADDVISSSQEWIRQYWQTAIAKGPDTLLIIDEIQKITQWSEVIKQLWDTQKNSTHIKLILLGSSSLALQKGLTESLTGRFEVIPVHHWNYGEMKEAFNFSWENYLCYGGYPGASKFINNYDRWFAYMKKSVIDTVIGQDILGIRTVQKPALFRQAFELLCHYPAQEISYNKLLGQLQDKGNTDLIKHYIELFEGAFLFRALSKFSKKPILKKTSSPKILPLCPALYTLGEGPELLNNPKKIGRVFELIVGADLNRLPGDLSYWRLGIHEVDYIYEYRGKRFAIEVKSGQKRKLSGLQEFCNKYPETRPVIITQDNYFKFSQDPWTFFETIAG